VKSFFISVLLGSIFLLSNYNLAAQVTTDTTLTFKVNGECGMCKQRIERAAKTKGVTAAKWNVETKELLLTYSPSKTTAEKVQEKIAGVGHDTELKEAGDAAYKALPDCCHYRELGAAKNHEKQSGVTTDETHSTSEVDNAITTISGSVVVDVKGELKPLAGASIFWLGTTAGTTTDAAGKFTLNPVSSTNQLVISYTGFHSETISVNSQSLQAVLIPNNKLKGVTVRVPVLQCLLTRLLPSGLTKSLQKNY
jgi:copper chaperone CopZ